MFILFIYYHAFQFILKSQKKLTFTLNTESNPSDCQHYMHIDMRIWYYNSFGRILSSSILVPTDI